MNEGFYNWTINVSDASNLTDQAPFRYFTIDYTSPNVILYAPEDNLTINTTNIKINFTAIDNLDLSLNCNLTINNQIAQTNIPAINNSFVSYSVSNFIDGLNYWNLTCFDDAGNIFTTETRLLNVSAPPSVVLNYPNNNHFQNQQNITLYYTPSDNMNLSVCELFVDNIYNQSNTEIINNQQNTFELSNLIEKTYFWAVRCNDTSNLSAFSETRNFTIDLTKPTIYLLQPNNGDTIYGRWTNFNFSVIDNYDFNLTCNITVDGSVKASNLNVLNNTATNFSVNVSDEGLHTYYITCIDDATNFNVSETRTYTTSNPPEVQLVFPNNNAIINYNLINFTYIPIDNNLANATLILNGIRNETNNTLTDEQENYFRLYLNDGIYNWTVNVTDQSYLYTMPNALSFIVDTTQPLITINHPNAETLDWNNITLNFSVIDNLLEPINCNISIDSALVFTNISINNNTNVIRYYALNDGSHNWQIKCIDLANNTAIASASFIVEAPPRVNLLMPINQTRTKEQQFLFEYKPYDVFGLNNCSLILDSQLNQTNETILNNQNNTFYVAYINEGLHNWTIRCYDNAPDYNLYEPNPYLFRIDLTGPTIILKEPFIDQTFNLNNITFNYTAIDSDNIIIDCNISVSDPFGNRLNFTSMPAGLDHIITIVNLTDGEHYWNVSCVDDLGNYNVSETRRFIINQPDLFLNNSRIYLNNTNPDLNENITIYVNVSNIGGLPVTNLLVNFYDGNPNNGGLFIGNSTNNVGINQTITFKTSWLINEGYHTIYVIADPYNQIAELNETNNNGTINISVLWANITYPKNQTWFNYLTLPINFTAFDYSGDNITYNVLIDNVPNGQTGSIIDASNNSINVTFTQGIRTIKIRVNDSYYYLGNTIQRIKDSLPITLYIDTTPPTINFNTLNLTWFNSEPIINFTITDNLDNLINYSIYVNNNIFTTGATNSTPNLINLTNLENGTHEIFIEAFDEAGNYINSSVLTIYLDSVKPTIYLLGPQNNINLLNNYATFNFSVIDNLDNLLQCNLTIDSQVNVSNINAYNNSINSTTVTNFKEGIHYWNVSCWDGNIITPVSLINTSDTYYFNIFNAPIITLIEPENNNWTNNSEVIFFFNVSEETGLQNCSILLNGQIQNTKQGNLLNKQGLNNITLTNLNGTYNWQIECYDNTTIYNYGISDSRTINVDLDSPIPYIETLNNTWFNYNNPLIYFNITDNMASLINYTFYINSTQNKNGSVNNATSTSVNLNPISDGYYLLTLEAFDLAYNRKNSSQIIIFVDTTKPTIMLENPENGFTTSNTNILFNFTAFDNLAQTMLCNLTIDNQIVQSFNTTNGFYNFTNVVMPAGMHYWNVSCSDSVGNFNTSETRYFIIPLPDLFVSSDYIFFNTTAPEENSNITINATIFNIGNTTAYNVTIQFWDGHYLNGTQINGNFTYNISAGENITINLSWKVPNIGEHKIYVLADPLIQTNGSIVESNETNNYAYKLIIVGSYTYVYGNFTGFLNLKDLTNQTLFKWDINDFNGSKIFAVDYDSNIDWQKLQSISRDINNNYVSNDFYEIDLALRMENNTDSINRTWILDNIPYYLKDYDVFLNNIKNIPFINSTNNTNFQTGILWDYSDGNTQYNGTQDLVFFTIVNINQTGIHGNYDYELKIPANLRYYKQPNTATIALYTELK
ncbi:MAG: CARDB domain-containing protein [Candidatus Woesearchaeota archaeon]